MTDPERVTNWERTTYVIMSDHVVLRKDDVRFKPADWEKAQYPEGRLHSYGWKKKGKLKNGDSTDLVRKLLAYGYVKC